MACEDMLGRDVCRFHVQSATNKAETAPQSQTAGETNSREEMETEADAEVRIVERT